MPYNTRRKSLSLPSLGIHVPVTHASRSAASRASPNTSSSSATTTTPTTTASTRAASPASAMASPASRDHHHPNKKVKRAHSEESDSLSSPASFAKKHAHTVRFDNTPPPSPPPDRASIEMADADDSAAPVKKIDLEGINDEIVEGVIVQLQNTDNRPHLVKELAAVLIQHLKVVQQSANPCAIISSRLSTYLKRNCWSALAPCPLAKELETVHPRRTYFYLTTFPHQPLPDSSHAATLSQLPHTRAIISPSLSSAASSANSEDADDAARRRELSPSPEVDLSSPEFDDMDDDVPMPSTPIGSLSMRGFGLSSSLLGCNSLPGSGLGSARHHRAASPPLEKDEKEFTQTADGLQKRKLSGDLLSASASLEQAMNSSDLDFGSRDDGNLFFGDKSLLSLGGAAQPTGSLSAATATATATSTFITSPAIKPSASFTFSFTGRKDGDTDAWAKAADHMLWWDRSPENIALEELDGMLNDY